MTSRMQCDGCHQMFSIADLRIHLSIDQYIASMKDQPAKMNARGNRPTTAPLVNFNDPQLSIQLCPRRGERVASAGATLCDEKAPGSLPVMLPFPAGRWQLVELKNSLMDAWEARQRQKSVEATQAAQRREPKGSMHPVRTRDGRNMLVDECVKKMHAKFAVVEAPPVVPLSLPPALPKKPLPDFMKPLQRVREVTQQKVPLPAANSRFVDPQAMGSARPYQKTVVLTSGQIAPVYIRM